MRPLTPLLLGALFAMPMVAVAQERTAGANLALETSWHALKTLADQANTQARVATSTALDARTRADNAMNRANEAHTVASGAQATANQAMSGVNNISYCGQHGMFFNGTSCRAVPISSQSVDFSRIQDLGPGHSGGPVLGRWSAEAQNLTCPANTVMVGIIVRTSGTCENRCNQDGPVIQSLVARCAPLQ